MWLSKVVLELSDNKKREITESLLTQPVSLQCQSVTPPPLLFSDLFVLLYKLL